MKSEMGDKFDFISTQIRRLYSRFQLDIGYQAYVYTCPIYFVFLFSMSDENGLRSALNKIFVFVTCRTNITVQFILNLSKSNNIQNFDSFRLRRFSECCGSSQTRWASVRGMEAGNRYKIKFHSIQCITRTVSAPPTSTPSLI